MKVLGFFACIIVQDELKRWQGMQMSKLSLKWISVLAIFVGFAAQAEVSQTIELSVICRLKKEVRTLRVEKADAGKCNAVYTKLGHDQNIGTASSQASCDEILRKVRVNLEAAAWKCREVKDSRVSNLIEL
jgi:hypothetical protein